MSDPTPLPVLAHGAGRSVVLVHGAGGSAATSFSAAIPALAREHRVLAVDLPAAGDWTLDAVADALAATIAQHTDAPSLLLGHSLGGAVVARTAARHPEVAGSLVLAASPWTRDPRLSLALRLWRRLWVTDRSALAQHLLLMTASPSWLATLQDRDVDDLARIVEQLLPDGTGLHLDLATGSEIVADLDRVTASVTAVLGDEDTLVRTEGWLDAAAAGRLEALVWSGGHDVLAHHTRELVDLVRRLA